MISKMKRHISRHLRNLSGWSTDRKIIVIESDDWGSIRMPSTETYNKFLSEGIPVDRSQYCKYDSLASEDDLYALFDILKKFKDSSNNHPVITANAVVANPDFNKIKDSDYQKYYFELITETFKRYPKHSNCLEIWKQGKADNVFYPQLHGREHVNVKLWLKLLQQGHPDFLFAFQRECWGLSKKIYPEMERSIQAALDAEDHQDICFHKTILREGCKIFRTIFGYISQSFIANNFTWDSSLNDILLEMGVKYLQGMKYQKHPLLDNKKRNMTRHYIGEKNKLGQYYLIRNCIFEPTQQKLNFDNIGRCMKDISNAFYWKKPAIISAHRLNFVGYLDPKNRDHNLDQLENLIQNILKTWPDVEFLTSVELGNIIEKDLNTVQCKSF